MLDPQAFFVSDTEARLGDAMLVVTPAIAPRRRFAQIRYWLRRLRLWVRSWR